MSVFSFFVCFVCFGLVCLFFFLLFLLSLFVSFVRFCLFWLFSFFCLFCLFFGLVCLFFSFFLFFCLFLSLLSVFVYFWLFSFFCLFCLFWSGLPLSFLCLFCLFFFSFVCFCLLFCFLEMLTFNESKCSIKNTTVQLTWFPSRGKVDSYDLEKCNNDNNRFESIYCGTEITAEVNVAYGETVRFRVYAENAAGEGKYSSELVMKTPKGILEQMHSSHI